MVTGWERYLKRQNSIPRVADQENSRCKNMSSHTPNSYQISLFSSFFLAVQCLQYNTLHQTSGGIH